MPAAPPNSWTQSQLRVTAILGPVVLFDLVLQATRVVSRYTEIIARPDKMEGLDWLSLLASPLLFHLGFATVCAAILRAAEGRRGSALATGAVQLLAAVTVAVNLSSYVYFLKTGSSLDSAQVAYTFGRFADLKLMADLVTPAQWAGLFALVAVVVLAPWLARRLVRHDPPSRSPPLVPALTLLGGVLLAALGFLPLCDNAVDRAVVRDPVLNVIATTNAGQQAAPAANVHRFQLAIARSVERPRRNVVIVILESTRALSVNPYVDLPTTPFFAQLAKQSLLVERAYTVIPSTGKALVASLCGIEPSHSVKPLSLALGMLERCLPALLAEQGYRTIFFQSADSRFEARIPTTTGMGFQQFVGTSDFPVEGFQRANFLGYEDEVMLEPSRLWLEAHTDLPFLATYLTVAAHHECFPIDRHGLLPLSGEPDLNRYLNNVRSDDFFLKELIDQYKRLGLYENTLFFVFGDHGEGFGEHGRHTHNDVPYEEGLRIPFLIHDGSGTLVKPGVAPGPVNQLDLVPTVLDLLGYRISRGKLPGSPIRRQPSDRALMASCLDEATCLVHLRGRDKLIHHYGRQPDELFDVVADPHEEVNLADRRPGEVAKKLGELRYWERRVASLYWGEGLLARGRR